MFLSEGVFSYFSKGGVFFIPANSHHYARSIRKSKPLICRFVYLNTKTVEELVNFIKKDEKESSNLLTYSKHIVPHVIHLEEYRKINLMLKDIIETCSPNEPHLMALIELKYALFLFEAYKTFGQEPKGGSADNYRMDAEIVSIAEYLSLNYDKSDRISDLSRLCNLSESQIRRRFAKVYGTTPIAYKMRLRCKIAAELLTRTSFPIQRIADRVGFGNVSDLYKAFKKQYGSSPSAYRSKNGR